MDRSEAGRRFFVGKLHGARSWVVHDGIRAPIPGVFHDYTAALVGDLLLDELGVATRKYADQVLAKYEVTVRETLTRLTAGNT